MASSKTSLPSEDTIPSTPITSDDAIFSDNAPHQPSSPPSSPPGFPWEQKQQTTSQSPSKLVKPAISVFSVLGKRKALAPVSDNVRQPKKVAFAPTTKSEEKPLMQMQISLGQEVQKKCKACGMEYIASSAEDRKLHDKYHKQNAEGFDVGKDFVSKAREGTVFDAPRAGDAIVSVDGSDSIWRRKRAKAALDVVQRELGAVEIPEEQLWCKKAANTSGAQEDWRYRVYMYIRGTNCVGVLLAERIFSAHATVEPAREAKQPPARQSTGNKPSSLAALRARRASSDMASEAAQPIRLATKPSPAVLGISRIWTSPSHRGQGLAVAMLDLALANTTTTHEMQATTEVGSRDLTAFSQPTEAGARLARRWFGRKSGWLVYVD